MRNTPSSFLTHPFLQILYYATIFFIPFYRWRHLSDQYPFLTVDWMLVVLLLIFLIPYYLVKKILPEELKSNLGPWYLLFLVVNLITLCFSSYPVAAINGIRLLIMGYIFIALSQMLITLEGFRRILPLVLIWSVTVCSFLAILGYFFQIETFTLGFAAYGVERGVGGTIGANNMSLMCLFILPLLIHWIFYARSNIFKFIAVILVLVDLLGLVSTVSRGGFLNLLIMIIFLALEHRKRFTPRYFGILLAAIGVVFILGILAVPQSFYERQKTLLKGRQADKAISQRAAYLDVGWESFLENPILGTGTDTFKEVWVNSLTALDFSQQPRGAHNTYMEVLVGSGIVGLLIFLCILYGAFANFSKAKKTFRKLGNAEMASIVGAYRVSFVSLTIYLLILSYITHKFFLLSLALSQISLTLAQREKDRSNDGYIGHN